MITKKTRTIIEFKDNGKELKEINRLVNKLLKFVNSDDIKLIKDDNYYAIGFINKQIIDDVLTDCILLEIVIIDNKINEWYISRTFSTKDRIKLKRIFKAHI